MPREAIVDLPCRVKHDLGDGNLRAGSRGLVNLLRAQEWCASIRARPRQDGKPIESIIVRMPHLTEHGVEELSRTVGELEEHVTRLAPLVPLCTNCPANAYRRPFGCVGGLPFPIARAVEVLALQRVTHPNSIGGSLLLQTLSERGIDGSVARGHRVDGKFEAMSGPSRGLDGNPFGKSTLTSDELFEPLLLANGRLEPWMSLNVLLWFDAVMLDDVPPATIDDVLALTRLDPLERPKRTKCRLGLPADPNAEPFRGLLKLLHVAWARDIDVMIDM